ncbi:MAG TPA: glycosyltransferase family 9 protein [Abditibacteriaceae bacterium]|jgi:ADP-heptose:LPS heptosyltransferase
MRHGSTSQPHRILIIRLSSIGDCVLASPVVEALRERYPDAEITWAVQAKSASVVQGLPGLADILLWDDSRTRWPSLAKALWRTRFAGFDVALDLQGISKAGLFLGASRAARRVSGESARRISRWSSTEQVPEPEALHARLAYLRRASGLDIAPDAVERFFPRVPVTAIHRRFADEFLGRAGINSRHKLVGINLGAAHAIKRWAPERFAQVVDTLLREDAATRVVVFGAPADAPLFEQFETELAAIEAAKGVLASTRVEVDALVNGVRLGRNSGSASSVVDAGHEAVRPGGAWRGRVLAAVGRINLLQVAAVGERCCVVVTADTGPMHIMAAVGAPIVALFGPTSVERTGPVQKPDGQPIRVLDASDLTGLVRAPMNALEVPMVLDEVRAMLNRKVPVPVNGAMQTHANGHVSGHGHVVL